MTAFDLPASLARLLIYLSPDTVRLLRISRIAPIPRSPMFRGV